MGSETTHEYYLLLRVLLFILCEKRIQKYNQNVYLRKKDRQIRACAPLLLKRRAPRLRGALKGINQCKGRGCDKRQRMIHAGML